MGSHLPTLEEIQALKSQTSSTNPGPSPLALSEILSFLNDKTVINFLFHPTPIHLPHLQTPHLHKKAIQGIYSATRASKSHAFADDVFGRYFFFPAFCSGDLIFGFGVHKHVYTLLHDEISATRLGCSRIVQDAAKKTLVSVIHFAELNFIRVESAQMLSSTRQKRCTIRLRRDKMMQAFEQGLDKYDISACTQAVQICIETRRCPLCDMDDGICVCAIRFADAAHPFDDEVFKRGMRVRLGSFRGVANCAKWENGRWMGMTMGCRVETRREGIGDVIEMLRRAAISDAVRPADPMDGILVLDCNSKYGRGVFESTGENAGMAESVGEWGDVCSEWVQSIHEDCGIVGSQVDAIPGEDMLFDTSIFFDMSGTEAGSVGTDGTVAGMSTMGGAEVSLTQTTIVANGGMPREAYLQTAGTSSEEGAASVSEAVRRSESDVQESEASKVRRLRAELRREKNRAAAARSNMRKKMMNDAYKAELKINKDKADMLRDKEMLLRRENMRLRKELGARDGSLGEGVV